MSKLKKMVSVGALEDELAVEFVGLIDESANAEETNSRIQAKLANIIALGLKRGRPRREEDDSEEIAA
jgi:hypothetical protein